MEKGSESRHNDSEDDSLTIDSDDDVIDDRNEEDNPRIWSVIGSRKDHPQSSISGISDYSDIGGQDPEDDLGINMENRNTQRKTDTDIRILIAYLRSLNDSRPPEAIPPLELDRYLSNFFTIVKKHDGNEYEPASLRGMLCSVERYLKMKNYQGSVTRDITFVSTRHALKYKQQKLRELGKGTKRSNEPFGKVTLDKVNQLFTAREMGPYTPMSIINSLCFMFIVHFRLRKAIDHKNLAWGDIKLRADQSGKEYILYEPILNRVQQEVASPTDGTTTTGAFNATSTKPETGRASFMQFCIWAQPDVPERDPIGIYKLYSQKRPPNMMHGNSPFYLGITTLHPSPVQAWYRTCAMGVNKLSDLVRMIRDITGLPRAALNPPAESRLSESYTVTKPTSVDLSHNHTPPSIHSLPQSAIFRSPQEDVYSSILSLSNSAKESPGNECGKNKLQFSLDQIKEEPIDQHPFNPTPDMWPKSEEEERTERLQLPTTSSVVSSGSDDTNSGVSSNVHTCPNSTPTYPRMSVMSEVLDAQIKFREMLQTLDPDTLAGFVMWLKKVQISRNPHTDEVQFDESTDVDDTPAKDDVKADVAASITLNITLTPGAMTGRAPITVTATASANTRKENSLPVCRRISTEKSIPTRNPQLERQNAVDATDISPSLMDYSRRLSATDVSPTEASPSPAVPEKPTWICPSNKRKRYAATESQMSKVHTFHNGNQATSTSTYASQGNPNTFSNTYTEAPPNGNHDNEHQMLERQASHDESVRGDSVQESADTVIENSNRSSSDKIQTFSADVPVSVAARSRPEDILSVFQPCLSTGSMSSTAAGGTRLSTHMIPQAHSSISQRLCNPTGRDLSMFIPVPLPYPGQIPSIMANRMMHNPAMLASFVNPVSAHVSYLQHHGVYRNSMSGVNTSTSAPDSIN